MWRPFALATLITLGTAQAVRAESTVDPLRLVPIEADVVVKVEKPSQLLEFGLSIVEREEVQGLSLYRDVLDSVFIRRIQQIVGYYERELGHSWRELVEQLAGHGGVLAIKFRPDEPEPAVLVVVQGRDAELTKRFAALTLDLLNSELARQDADYQVGRNNYSGFETYHMGPQFHAAVIDSAIILTNVKPALNTTIDLHQDQSKQSILDSKDLQHARQMLTDNPAAWAWVNFQEAKDVKDLLDTLWSEPIIRIIAGGLLDVARRSPFICAGLYQEGSDVSLRIRMPRGREGMDPGVLGHAPPQGQPGALPLLKPKNVIASTSLYADLNQMWLNRKELFAGQPDQLKSLEEAEAQTGLILVGTRASRLLSYLGARHRIVVAQQGGPTVNALATGGYGFKLPAFAAVLELREPEKFQAAAERPLRGLALLLKTQVDMEMVEEMHGEHKIVGYRFAEDSEKNNQATVFLGANFLQNISPCFVRVGDQFVISSTFELARDLVDALEKEDRTAVGDAAAMRSWTSWEYVFLGVGSLNSLFLGAGADSGIVDAVLNQGITAEEAKKQEELFAKLIKLLGTVEQTIRYEQNEYRLDLAVKSKLRE